MVGTPGTGKSKTAELIAKFLDVPYLNIDAASMPDFYTASAQLLGSGRGIVGSYKRGKLEEAAKNPGGIVIEISDLDHSTTSVRTALADLFLQVLETGMAQSATGSLFSCANIIFIFTLNLPEGKDESIQRSFGFNKNISRFDVQRKFISELKNFLSTAFLSRIGKPILFEKLNEQAMLKILENTLINAVKMSLRNLNVKVCEIKLEDNLCKQLFSNMKEDVDNFGARIIHEIGQTLVAKTMVNLKDKLKEFENKDLIIFYENNQLKISTI